MVARCSSLGRSVIGACSLLVFSGAHRDAELALDLEELANHLGHLVLHHPRDLPDGLDLGRKASRA